LIVPPRVLSELDPLFCRSPRKPVRNDCKADVSDVPEALELPASRFAKAVFKVETEVAVRPEFEELAPRTALSARSVTRVCSAATIPC